MTTARSVFPISFDLYNENEEQVLFITDDDRGQKLTLDIVNTSDKPTRFKSLSGNASANNHHFELIFRPGVLFNSPPRIALESTEFHMYYKKDRANKIVPNSDGTLSLYFKAKFSLTLSDKISINLKHIRAAISGGTRSTRVLLKYKNLLHAGNTKSFSGHREIHLNIVNHQGHKDIPMYVGFVGHNTVINNGIPNTLRLRISNTSRKNKTIHANSLSKLVLSLEGGPAKNEWTAATDAQLRGMRVEVKYPGDSVALEEHKFTGVTRWEMPFKELEKNQFIDISISNFVTKHPTGHANLFLHYENIPDYQDGVFVALVEKSPISSENKNIGIETNSPSDKLEIGTYNSRKSFYLAIKTAGGSAYKAGIRLKHYNDKVGWTLVSDDTDRDFHILRHYNVLKGKEALSIKGSNGNVGINTPNPSQKLHIGHKSKEDTYIRVEAGGTGSNYSGIMLTESGYNHGMTLRHSAKTDHLYISNQDNNLRFKDLVTFQRGGNVGIGTSAPSNKLDIGDYGNNKDTYLAIKTTGGNQHKAGIKLRHYSDKYGFDLISDETKNSFFIKQHFNNAAGKIALSIDYDINTKLGGNLEVSGNLILNNEKYILPKNNTYVRLGNSQSAFQDLFSRYTYFGTNYRPSDPSLKENIIPLDGTINALEIIENLTPVAFDWNTEANSRCSIIPDKDATRQYGFLADEVAQCVPHSVTKIGDSDVLGVNYDALNTILFEGVRQQQKLISDLQEENLQIKDELASLKKEISAIKHEPESLELLKQNDILRQKNQDLQLEIELQRNREERNKEAFEKIFSRLQALEKMELV